QADDLDRAGAERVVEDAAQFDELLRVARGQQDPGAHEARDFCCRAASSAHPTAPRSTRVSSSARLKTPCSPVPWTSTKSPAPVHTTFMSTSATTSSS